MKPIFGCILFAMCFDLWPLSAQTVPSLMNYQGRLTDEAGAPLSNGVYRLAFRLYTNTIPVANEPLIWGREYEATLIGGVFNVVLGAPGGGPVAEAAVNDLTFAFTEPNRFLELRIVRDAANNTMDQTILPRQQLLSSPYAFKAASLIKEFQEALCPPGTIVAFGGGTIPEGWMLCDGSAHFATNFPKLFAAIQTAWGAGYNGDTKVADFNLPDLRGMFLRGVNGTRTGTFSDPDIGSRTAAKTGGLSTNNVGSSQGHNLQVHSHQWAQTTSGASDVRVLRSWTSSSAAAALTTILEDWDAGLVDNASGKDNSMRVAPTTAVSLYTKFDSTIGQSGETRPINAYVHYIIKY